METIKLQITTSAAGAGTATHHFVTPKVLYAIEWIANSFDGGGTATFTSLNASGTNSTLFTLTSGTVNAWYYPRVAAVDGTVGALSVYAEPVINGSLRFVSASGGSAVSPLAVCYVRDIEGR